MSIVGIGIDLVQVDRFEREHARRGADVVTELLLPEERSRCAAARLPRLAEATCFAAKEAFFKALGTGRRGELRWHHVEVRGVGGSSPSIHLRGAAADAAAARGAVDVRLSLATSRSHAAAIVVLIGESTHDTLPKGRRAWSDAHEPQSERGGRT